MATGRVTKRGNKWSYVINLPMDPITGRYPQKWKMGFATKKEAQDALKDALNRLDQKNLLAETMTVAEYLSEWLEKTAAGKAPRTQETYEFTVTHYLTPKLGAITLAELKAHQIERLYRELSKTHAPSTVHRTHRVLRTALNRALKWGYLERSPLSQVDTPSLRYEKRNVLSAEQIHQCLDSLREISFPSYIAAYLATHTGMRRGEIAGLQWADIDWDKQVLRVQRTRQHRPMGEIVGPTKTSGSNRSILVGNTVLDELSKWKSQLEESTRKRHETWSDFSYVVSYLDGGYPAPELYYRNLRSAVKQLGLPPVTFHDLRHSHATLLLEEQVPMKVISERLGHASIQLTANLYTHVTARLQEDAANAVEKVFRRKER
jgi:integrase